MFVCFICSIVYRIVTIANYAKPAVSGSTQDNYGTKALESLNLALYNVEICGESNGVCFALKRFDIGKKISIKDIVPKKKLVFLLKSWFCLVNIACVFSMC